MPDGSNEDLSDKQLLRIPWRTVALTSVSVSICVSVGALGALAVVASMQDADGLSTVALALAILAFTSQILVFVAQVFASNQQTSRQDELYARMNGLLEGLKGTTNATQATMERHMGVLLKAAVGEAAEVVGESTDTDGVSAPKFNAVQFEQRVLDRAREVAAESRNPVFNFEPPRPEPDPASLARINELETYPERSEETEAHVEALKGLSPWAVQVLAHFGEDEVKSLRSGIPPGLRKARQAPITKELAEHGLVEFSGDEDPTLTRLTDKGRAVARLIIPPSRPPDWIISHLGNGAIQGDS